MQIRKICIKSIAVFMAAIVMVSTPLSRFADTKGVSETHAVAPALITLGGLFGAIAGAYGLYVAADKLADYAENWFNWTADNATDARTDLQKIKDGITSYVITKAVTNSVADYLSTQVSDEYTHSLQGVKTRINSLTADSYSSSFMDYYENTLSANYAFPFAIIQADDFGHDSGEYLVVYVNPSYYSYQKIVDMHSDENVKDIVYHTKSKVVNGSNQCVPIAFTMYDSAGLPLYFSSYYNPFENSSSGHLFVYDTFYYKSGAWVKDFTATPLRYEFNDSVLDSGNIYTLTPFYRTNLTSTTEVNYDVILDNSFAKKRVAVDYKTHGNNALDNVDALTGAEVSEDTLTHLYDVSSEAYQNYLKSQQDNNDDNNDINYAPLASAMTAAIIASLKDMGYIKNPTDEPSGENVKEQLGNIQISLDGLIDAISQINPAQGLANIAQGIAELPQKITASVTDAIRNVFEDLFVPDEGAIQDKVDEITDKFAFADSLLTVVDDIDGALKNASGPPEIYIHFEDAEDSKYTPIGTLKLLSFEWYERYKPYGDALLSSMLWLFFLWKVRKRIAEIVQGLSVSGESDANASANSAIGIERGRSS